MFGVDRPHGLLQGIATVPEFIWELGLGIYATFLGFRAVPVLSAYGDA